MVGRIGTARDSIRCLLSAEYAGPIFGRGAVFMRPELRAGSFREQNMPDHPWRSRFRASGLRRGFRKRSMPDLFSGVGQCSSIRDRAGLPGNKMPHCLSGGGVRGAELRTDIPRQAGWPHQKNLVFELRPDVSAGRSGEFFRAAAFRCGLTENGCFEPFLRRRIG